MKSAIHHLGERDSTFTETALLDEALKAGLGDVSHAEIASAISDRAGGLIDAGEVDRGEGKKEAQFTTKTAVFREAEILQRARDGQGKAEAVIAISDQESKEVVPEDVSFTNEEIENGKRSDKNGNNGSRGPGSSAIGSLEEVGTLTEHGIRDLSECRMDADEKREDSSVLSDSARTDRPGNQHLRWANDHPRVAAVIAEREAKQGFAFSQGQRNAVALALTTEDQHIGIVGAAGAGKTTAMAAIVEQYKAAGYEIIGVAPSAAASKELESAGCDDTRTLASALLQKQGKDGETPPKRLYVMDESGMVSAKDMDAFMRKADAEGARTIMVGDPLQLAAVEAGSPYAQMLATGAIAHADIDEIQRQKDPQLREIAQAFAKGDVARGVELAKPYMQQVKIDEDGGKEAKTAALAKAAAAAYLELSPDERSKTLLLAGTNATRQAINRGIRDGLKAEGTLGDHAVKITALDKLDLTREAATRAEHYTSRDGAQVIIQFNSDLKSTDHGKDDAPLAAEKGSQWDVTGTAGGKLQLRSRADPSQTLEMRPTDARISAYAVRDMELRAGDRVVFRQNDRERGVSNGTGGTVQINENGKASVRTDAGKTVALDTDRGQTMDYSYARTVHSSQGATVERAIVAGEASRVATAESAYVACSREKTGLTIITDDSEKLGKAWGRFADRQAAMEAAKIQAPESLEEIQNARRAAGREIGSVGDLAQAREQAQEQQEQETVQETVQEQQEQDQAQEHVQEQERELADSRSF
ncbi:MAG: ATP-dependent DNA helicase [Acidithiobacillus sp.]